MMLLASAASVAQWTAVPDAVAAADAGWVTMHGPKIEHKRREGEINAALACGGGTEQLDDSALDRILAAPPAEAAARRSTEAVASP